MAQNIETEIVVLGGGPGGYAAAFLAADLGMRTTLIDAGQKPGGACLHIGCIPSKALLHAAQVIHAAHDAAAFGITFGEPKIDIDALRAKKEKIIAAHNSHLLDLTKKREITHVVGRGAFADGSTIQVEKGPKVAFKHAIIATGSVPAKLPTFEIGSKKIWDSTAALNLETIPKTLLVVGGGYIGLEMGSVYAALGSKVTVVELTPSLLPGVDPDLIRPLHQRLKSQFANILLKTKVTKVEDGKEGVKATFEGDVAEKEQTFERVMVAVGRKPATANLGLDKADVKADDKGFIVTDEQRRTSNPKVFAIGDAAGEPMLAHKASHEGKLAVQVIKGEPLVWEPRAIPAVVFTDPEIAWAGLMENEAKARNREVKTARFHWAASGRATTLGRSDGVTKLVVDPKTDQLLGVGLCGPGAGELISEAVVAMEMGATAKDIALSIHPHPTLTETISEAAETLHGLSSHIYIKKSKVL